MFNLRIAQSNDYNFMKTIFGEMSKSRSKINLPEGYNLVEGSLNVQDGESNPRFLTVDFDQKPIGSAYYCYMARSKSAYFALGLSPEFRGKKIGTEVASKIVERIFNDTPAHRIEAGAAIDNQASNRVLEKCGFIKEGIQRKAIIVENVPQDYVLWGILREDFKK